MSDMGRLGRRGWCSRFPPVWADLLWGLNDPPGDDPKAGYDLRRAGVRICEMCPVRAKCLAWALVDGTQDCIQGGLPLKARRRLKASAMEAGVRFDQRSGAKIAADAIAWIKANPEEVGRARQAENAARAARYAAKHEHNKQAQGLLF